MSRLVDGLLPGQHVYLGAHRLAGLNRNVQVELLAGAQGRRSVYLRNQRLRVRLAHEWRDHDLHAGSGCQASGCQRIAAGLGAVRKDDHAPRRARREQRQTQADGFGQVGLVGDGRRGNFAQFRARPHGTFYQRIRAKQHNGGLVVWPHPGQRLAQIVHLSRHSGGRHRIGHVHQEDDRQVIPAAHDFHPRQRQDQAGQDDQPQRQRGDLPLLPRTWSRPAHPGDDRREEKQQQEERRREGHVPPPGLPQKSIKRIFGGGEEEGVRRW